MKGTIQTCRNLNITKSVTWPFPETLQNMDDGWQGQTYKNTKTEQHTAQH